METSGRQFEKLTADAGYFSANNVTAMDTRQVDAYIAAGSDQWRHLAGRTVFGKGQFSYEAETDAYQCPADQVLPFQRTRTESVGGGPVRTVHVYKGDRATCGACPLKDQCLSPKHLAKSIRRGPDDDIRDAMKAKVRSDAGAAIYRTSKGQVEPAFGIIKETLGFRQFSLRGLTKATGKWALVCLTYNVRKMGRKIQRIAQATGQICTIASVRASKAAGEGSFCPMRVDIPPVNVFLWHNVPHPREKLARS